MALHHEQDYRLHLVTFFSTCLVVYTWFNFVVLVKRHVANYNAPVLQRLSLRVAFLVPAFSLLLYASFLDPQHAGYFEALAGLTEGFALFSFFMLLVVYCDGEFAVIDRIHKTLSSSSNLTSHIDTTQSNTEHQNFTPITLADHSNTLSSDIDSITNLASSPPTTQVVVASSTPVSDVTVTSGPSTQLPSTSNTALPTSAKSLSMTSSTIVASAITTPSLTTNSASSTQSSSLQASNVPTTWFSSRAPLFAFWTMALRKFGTVTIKPEHAYYDTLKAMVVQMMINKPFALLLIEFGWVDNRFRIFCLVSVAISFLAVLRLYLFLSQALTIIEAKKKFIVLKFVVFVISIQHFIGTALFTHNFFGDPMTGEGGFAGFKIFPPVQRMTRTVSLLGILELALLSSSFTSLFSYETFRSDKLYNKAPLLSDSSMTTRERVFHVLNIFHTTDVDKTTHSPKIQNKPMQSPLMKPMSTNKL